MTVPSVIASVIMKFPRLSFVISPFIVDSYVLPSSSQTNLRTPEPVQPLSSSNFTSKCLSIPDKTQVKSTCISSPLFLVRVMVLDSQSNPMLLISSSLRFKKLLSISLTVSLQFFVTSSGYGEFNL